MSASPPNSSLPAKPPPAVLDVASDAQQQSSSHVSDYHGQPPVSSRSVSPSSIAEKSSNEEGPASEQPLLPEETLPPLPNEAPPSTVAEDDGWEPIWDENAQAFYFYNRHTQLSQWENPRVSEGPASAPGTAQLADTGPPGAAPATSLSKPARGGYDPAIHGDYDPNADYAKVYESARDDGQGGQVPAHDQPAAYTATGAFNRFTGKWQSTDVNPEKFNDENKSKRQMNAFFDVDAAASAHDGRSLRAERSSKKLTKAELKAYREKRRERKEEKKRAWLRD